MKRTPKVPTEREFILMAKNINDAEARFAVQNYLDMQERRKRADMQIRHLGDKDEVDKDGDPKTANRLLVVDAENCAIFEAQYRGVMKHYAENHPIGRWILSLHGVGPIIATGLLAHINIEIARTAGAVWRYAGLDPSCKWEKGQKRPYNAALKQICFHFGECQVKVSNHPDAFYGKLYREKKAELVKRNERGGFAEKAAVYKGVSDAANKKLLAQGKVPPAYIDKCARRFCTKIFLSHLHAIMHFCKFGTVPPPFAHGILGHVHLFEVPNASMFPGFIEAYRGNVRMLEAAE